MPPEVNSTAADVGAQLALRLVNAIEEANRIALVTQQLLAESNEQLAQLSDWFIVVDGTMKTLSGNRRGGKLSLTDLVEAWVEVEAETGDDSAA